MPYPQPCRQPLTSYTMKIPMVTVHNNKTSIKLYTHFLTNNTSVAHQYNYGITYLLNTFQFSLIKVANQILMNRKFCLTKWYSGSKHEH